jgi:hypothetical protein
MNRVKMLHYPLARLKVSGKARVLWDYEQFSTRYRNDDEDEYRNFVDELEDAMVGSSELELSGRIVADRLCSAHSWDGWLDKNHSG